MTFVKRVIGSAIVAAAGFVGTAALTSAMSAEVDGLAAMHDMRREGKHMCFSDHYHYGSSAGQSSKRSAQAAAIGSWADFVNFEYGSTWAHYGKASGKEVKCSQSGSGWGCDVSARPCI